MRLSIINFAGIARTLVAVGRVSESSMLLTTREATPRRTSTRAAPGVIRTGAGRTTGSAGVGVGFEDVVRTTCCGADAAGAVAAGGEACADAEVTGAMGAAGATGATGATGAAATCAGAGTTGAAGAATTGAAETSLARTCVGVGTLGALVADFGIGGTPPRGAVGIAP